MRIIAIGGGSVGEGETLSIDREIIQQAGKPNPRALFIPTASNDSEEYAGYFRKTYVAEGCTVDVLRLLSGEGAVEASAKLDWADLVYVGGGNTHAMLVRWREVGLDKMLADFVAKDKPVSGLSAGALCWFRVGNSDWPQFYDVPNMNTAPLACLGLVNLALCPHTRDEGFRLAEFSAMMMEVHGVGVGLDDGCALQIHNDQYRIISSMSGSVAHKVYRQGTATVHEVLEPHEDFRALTSLQELPGP